MTSNAVLSNTVTAHSPSTGVVYELRSNDGNNESLKNLLTDFLKTDFSDVDDWEVGHTPQYPLYVAGVDPYRSSDQDTISQVVIYKVDASGNYQGIYNSNSTTDTYNYSLAVAGDGLTINPATSPVLQVTLAGAVDKLRTELCIDPELYASYQANIAMSFKDEYDRQAEARNYTDLGKLDMHDIANTAAKNFLDLFIKK